jgi:hypothetical protein
MNTTFLAGNGAIEGGWEPIKRAILKTFGKTLDRDPNLAFANLTYQLRWLKFQKEKGICGTAEAFDKKCQTYEELKNNICCEITKDTQNGRMRVRDGLNRALQRFSQGHTCVGTTNWDRLFEPYLREQIDKLIYVHGSVKYPDSLYLPTESIIEPYRPYSAESCLHGRIAGGLMSVLQDTNKLVIYGLSLSPLDVELDLVIADGFKDTSNPKSAIIVDPEHEFVKERLCFFLPDVEPKCYHPEDLSQLLRE